MTGEKSPFRCTPLLCSKNFTSSLLTPRASVGDGPDRAGVPGLWTVCPEVSHKPTLGHLSPWMKESLRDGEWEDCDASPASILFYSQGPDCIWVSLPFLLSLSCCPHVLAGAPVATLDPKVTSRTGAGGPDGASPCCSTPTPPHRPRFGPALRCLPLDFCLREKCNQPPSNCVTRGGWLPE